MPELPEVEFAAHRLRHFALNKTVAKATSLHPAFTKRLWVAEAKRLQGRTLVEVQRRAKIQLLTFDDGQILEVHFRMNGDWAFGASREPFPAYERFRLLFTDGTRVSLVDSRALAVVVRHDTGALVLPALGPEPLTDALTPRLLMASLAARRAPIKQVLLDQRVVAGIGNIYASEALWEARMHPATPANTLSLTRVARLIDAIRVVLRRAQGERYHMRHDAPVATSQPMPETLHDTADNTTVDDVDVHAPPDVMEFRVYDREGEPCVRHPHSIHSKIVRLVQGARSTYYCARCQR